MTQLERGAIANPSLWGRVAQLVGVPPAPSMFGVPTAVLDDVVFAVSAVVCLALVVAWWAARRPAGSSLERYGVVVVVLTAAGLTWPAAFYYHYAAFLAPFLALPLGLAAGRLYARESPGARPRGGVGPGRGGQVHAVRVVQTTDPPGLVDIAWLDRACPPEPAPSPTTRPSWSWPTASAPPGVQRHGRRRWVHTVMVRGPRGYQSLSQPRAITDWLGVLGQTGYVVVTQGMVPARVPSGPALLDYLHAHFHLSAEQAGVVVWARRSS